MSGESVKVAVRVRPFNSRETDRGSKCCIEMIGALTQISDPDTPGAPPKEIFYTLMSFLIPFCSGFNCSLFAYGQTGSGKSYSMVGYGVNKGIVPITCNELFNRMESNTDTGVVRQNPKENSFFVQGLKKLAVGSYKEIEKRTDEGTANRTVAATQMNATSSRAHTVVTIMFDQILKNDSGQETKKSSFINLVDLAGSERADSTGATGDRLKEGANINKSLSALGNVISALADLSMGKKKVLVPYRDSALTKLLQNALGGNSKTIMIAALSPADINYDETLGTLRYADRAKKIKNKAVVNENPMDKLIRELKQENDKLKKALEGGMMPETGGGNMTPEELDKMRRDMQEEIRAQLEANMDSMTSWDEKLEVQRTHDKSADNEANERNQQLNSIPHIVNLNEDSLLSGVVVHFLDKDEVTIGNKKADPSPSILLSGLSILKQHAVITVKENEITIKPAISGSKTKVNGMPLTGETPLKHMDRILFGSNHMYYLKNPKNADKSEGSPDKVDWDFAQKEIAEAKGFATGFGAGQSKEQQLAQEQVLELLPLVSEVNAVSEELDKGKAFEVILISAAAQGSGTSGTKVAVKMKSMMNGNVWLWDRGKFMNRRYLIQEMYQKFIDNEDISKIPKEEDPFWEDVEDVLIGTANLFLQSLAFALDFDDKLTVTDYKGSEEASLVVNVTPCTQTGKALDEDNFVENPTELLDKPYHYKVTLRTGEIHKSRFSKGIYVKYKTQNDETFTMTETKVNTLSPEFNHTKIFSIPKVTQETLDWFDSGCITFLMYGRQEDTLADPKLAKMTTKELRQMEHIKGPGMGKRSGTVIGDTDTAQLKAELVLLKRKNERLLKKEKRIQDLCEEWSKKPPAEQQFDGFHRAVMAAANYQSGRLKGRILLLTTVLKAQKGITANGGELKLDQKQPQGSRACNLM
ncbi:hypothetical protein QZH41_019651 [Actinostola sp. cb2023]|nr:hypothetical protein QZH41_019651 [Actinostola sp. cb2023]